MPSLDDRGPVQFTKMLLIGDSGTGKTGALASLASAGYKLRIIDLDNGLSVLYSALKAKDPAALSRVEYISIRDARVASSLGITISGVPKAFPSVCKMLTNWHPASIGQTGTILGKPSEFGEDTILVIDSLTYLGDAAWDWAKALNPSAKDDRQIYGIAQDAISNVLHLLTGADMHTNVIVIAHVNWIERPDGTTRGYPTAIGKALSTKISTFFNITALTESSGSPPRRTIRTASTALVDLKSPVLMSPQLPQETGLAEFFTKLKD